MIEGLIRGVKAMLKGELILWTILLVLSGVIYLITNLL